MNEAQAREIKLHNTMDAKDWTEEFLRLNPNTGLDFGTMIGWFANAIMSGWDHAHWKLKPEIEQTEKKYQPLVEALKKIDAQTMPDLSDNFRDRSFQLAGLWAVLKMIANEALSHLNQTEVIKAKEMGK